ncbi:MAG: GNAT family N-acetyltransferase [Candidatus Heimdallarchaeota archaeon]|nr:GNAT family N-acetyltransferase [Candidatus Heimdallarchaeota archaeon]
MALDITIRNYIPEDWSSVKLIILESEYYSPKDVKSEKKRVEFYSAVPEKGRVFVAVMKKDLGSEEKFPENLETKAELAAKEVVLGFVTVDFFGRGIFILSLAVAAEYRRRGIGKALVEYLKKFGVDDAQFNILRGFADERFMNAHAFLLKQGFKTCGFIQHDLDWNHSAIHYVLPLRKLDEIDSETPVISA